MMTTVAATALRQRADYTHAYNATTGRHGWLRLTPAYSVKIVDEIVSRHERPLRVLDPFCGTATTALSAAYRGHTATTTDINPFLVWLGQAKTNAYSRSMIESAIQACDRSLRRVGEHAHRDHPPPLFNIDRWWAPEVLEFLCALKASIAAESALESPVRTLLLVAFCRTLIACSNAAFNHQSMSFKDRQDTLIPVDTDVLKGLFRDDVQFVLSGAEDNPPGTARVIAGDARNLTDAVDGKFDLVVTSPPYANRMSYVRELRPYMYWLDFLESARDAGELDWQAIGGTWGVATSRLMGIDLTKLEFTHAILDEVKERMSDGANKNGTLLANYVAKYFDDIWQHLGSLTDVLAHDCEVHYIVGNSTFYGVLLPVERLYAEMLERLGFADVKCRALRKRNSKKELFEFEVSACWP